MTTGHSLPERHGVTPDRFSKKHYAALIAAFQEATGQGDIPVCFSHRRPKVLKVGAFEDLLVRFPQSNRDALGKWLCRWTGSYAYQTAIVARNHRHDLDGNDVAPIDDGHREFAMRKVKAMEAKRARALAAAKSVPKPAAISSVAPAEAPTL